jgi:hypothetical protein
MHHLAQEKVTCNPTDEVLIPARRYPAGHELSQEMLTRSKIDFHRSAGTARHMQQCHGVIIKEEFDGSVRSIVGSRRPCTYVFVRGMAVLLESLI